MSRRHKVLAIGNQEYILCGSFAPAGAGAPTSVFGAGFTVVRTAEGLFTVTVAEPAIRIRAGHVTLQKAAASDLLAELAVTDIAVARTFQIRLATAAGVETDLAADANNRVHFILMMSLDTVQA
jgi:hypothetical protein